MNHSLVARPLPVFNVTSRFFLHVTLKTLGGSGLDSDEANESMHADQNSCMGVTTGRNAQEEALLVTS